MYAKTPRTTSLRERDRMNYDRQAAHDILDEAWHCTVSFVVDGEPRTLPTLFVRVDDAVYVHASTGSRPFLAARGAGTRSDRADRGSPEGRAQDHDGLSICFSVTHLDGLILARSQFHHSANYRSLVAHGVAALVTDEDEKLAVLTALVEKLGTGRAAETRPPDAKELAQTAMLKLPLHEVSVRTRTGGVNDEPADLDLPHWAGVIPLKLTRGQIEPDTGVSAPLPDYLRTVPSPWHEAPTLTGEHVELERLTMDHVDGLFAAIGRDDDVWRFLLNATPQTPDEMAKLVADAEAQQVKGARVPFVQRDAATGEIVGTTSYYGIDPLNRSVNIGITALGKRWWRSGVNTESKLLLLRHAFDTLGCVRVQWEAHSQNVRSHAAIERLGATREGTLRRHKLLADGTWRDTAVFGMTAEEWPNAQEALIGRLLPRTVGEA